MTARGLVAQTPMTLASGHASEVTVYRVRFGADEWLELAPTVAKVQLRADRDREPARRVPPHLLHLF